MGWRCLGCFVLVRLGLFWQGQVFVYVYWVCCFEVVVECDLLWVEQDDGGGVQFEVIQFGVFFQVDWCVGGFVVVEGFQFVFWWCNQVGLDGFDGGYDYCVYQYYGYWIVFGVEQVDYLFVVGEQFGNVFCGGLVY